MKNITRLIKILLTTNLLVLTTLPTLAHPLKPNQQKEQTSISDYINNYGSPCHKNPRLPQC